MPYLLSQHFREKEHPTYGLVASSRVQMEAAGLAADPLTGFANLKEFYRLGEPLVRTCLSKGMSCAVAIVDIDHFQRLKDVHCKETIVQVVNATAARLRAACGGNRHLFARLGDEEFGMLLVDLDGAAATELCEKLRLEIAGIRIIFGDIDFPITVSIGLAEVGGPETFDNYLNAAEQFLFMARSHGRNRVFSDYTMVLQAAG
ncbi:GGDEF domain-containing protein [Neorhizobium galegae]|uniref:GGDEF domain-containing protein n=1 Tax=Neorhizobium galegae TaxID=399 RepID=UPI000621D893|nr:GGDEF domain-containing protein [Neorhizobium galegae]CDZ27399.1 Diguanylate cyclase (GGDEF) domain-containing protein [Neorhizobium galegae bv. officinalis]KAA9387252.1 GGDEF domain-containing protein [Neorhizobium galegae]KAB1114398.1 GGDEF domain-containing protein [Neorhizobium galegae]MCM2497516.1 GGDEF domain-containing protein [Neorhizobium galegae]MCQ1771606.1 GGDEF domain-containing protein [Neorhizobium galegae]